jgi:biotin-(acetyl-CoA carboxylase) ligase
MSSMVKSTFPTPDGQAMSAEPTFPPLLSGHRLAAGIFPMAWAAAKAAKEQLGAGDLAWSEETDDLRLALVLEPEVERARCQEIIYVAMVAIVDSLGALCPPQVAFTYKWPSIILANGAQAGSVDLVISKSGSGVPDWMVLSLHIRLKPGAAHAEPGSDPGRTTLWDEGCGMLGHKELVESISRHLVNLIHLWTEDGFKPIHEQWRGRLSSDGPIAARIAEQLGDGTLLGLDETGNAVVRTGAVTRAISMLDALERLRAGGEAVS